MNKKEIICRRHADESDTQYAFFMEFLASDTRVVSQFSKDYKKCSPKYISLLSSKFNWIKRATNFDVASSNRRIETVSDILDENAKKFCKLHGQIIDKVSKALEEKGIEEIKRLAPSLSVIFGKGGTGEFLVSAYQAMHGEKHNIKSENKSFNLNLENSFDGIDIK